MAIYPPATRAPAVAIGLLRTLALLAFAAGATCGAPREMGRHDLGAEILEVLDHWYLPLPRFAGAPSAGLRFAPREGDGCPPALARATPEPDREQRRRWQELARQVQRSTAGTETADSLRLRALWALLAEPTGAGRGRAVRLLRAALAGDPAAPGRRNDLAAAYLLQASLDGQPEDFVAALDVLDAGIQNLAQDGAQDGNTALINRSYALQCLTLWRDAEETWRRLAPSLTAPFVAGRPVAASQRRPQDRPKDPLVLRRRGEWLLGEWGIRILGAEPGRAAAALAEAAAIGRQLTTGGGDPLLSAAADTILTASARGDRATLAGLARGHAIFHAVRRDAIYSECRPAALRTAATALRQAGSPFGLWVEVDQAVCAYYDQDFRRADQILDRLATVGERRGWPALVARVAWLQGLVDVVRARFVEGDRRYAHAIEVYSRLGEIGYAVYLHALRATLYEYAGERAAAWRERLAGLRQRGLVTDPERRTSILFEAVDAMRAQGYPTMALRFLSEQMRAAQATVRETGKTDLLAFTLLARARALAELGRLTASAAAVRDAEDAWSRLPAGNGSRRQLRVEIDLQRALTDPSPGRRQALAAVARARGFFAGRAGLPGQQMELLKLDRMKAHLDQQDGDTTGARADLLKGAGEVERQRLDFATMEDRAQFLAQWRGLFLDLTRLEIDTFHDPRAALVAFERGSNRVFGENGAGDHTAADFTLLSAPDWLAAMPPETLVLRFGHLPDRLLLWSFANGRMQFEQRFVAATELGREIDDCRASLAAATTGSPRNDACQYLAQILLPQALRHAPHGLPVLVIPDELLAPLSLAALQLAPASPPLASCYRLSYAPGLVPLLTVLRRSVALPHAAPPKAPLFVSDPAFRGGAFAGLPRLPAAAHAAQTYARQYSQPHFLSDRRATLPAVLGALAEADLLQFDGHGLSNPQFPERGGLLLAPIGAGEGVTGSLLTAADLPARLPHHLRLVVLGSCSSGLTPYRGTSEVTGLAAAFLARGVPEVLATAWPVRDNTAAALLERFHRRYSQGEPADAALQAAQTECAAEGRDIASWSAFQLFRSRPLQP